MLSVHLLTGSVDDRSMGSDPLSVQVTTGHPRDLAHWMPQGISADLAEARARLRRLAGEDLIDAVLDEVKRVQAARSTTLLAAMDDVHARWLTGWRPAR